jgi:16S rRNA (adenine1518-N6/adenine1519-N6)-dimethyltransferase
MINYLCLQVEHTKIVILKAKKSYGQHFLKNPGIASKIASSLSGNFTNVLEIGPGTGNLTQFLIHKGYKLIAVEADQDMADILYQKFSAEQITILKEDFLQTNLSSIFNGESFAIIGNFPYNISSQIVFKILDNHHLVPEMVGMFQKEVAQRIVSPPGNKDYGILSVLTQSLYSGKYLFSVDKNEFSPPPKIQSGVIRLTKKSELKNYDRQLFTKLVKTSFGQRRKMLRNTLKNLLDPQFLDDPFFTQRPEQLSVDDFINLTLKIQPHVT